MGGKAENFIRKTVNILFGILCMFILGTLLLGDKRVAYPDWAKNYSVLSNITIAIIEAAVLGVGIMVWKKWISRWEFLQKLTSEGFYPVLWIMAVLLFGAQVYISYHLYFILGWDVSIVAGTADWIWTGERGIGDEYYFSQYPNNVAIVYILAGIYRAAVALGLEVYRYFVSILADCVLIDLAGGFGALSVKRLTGSPKAGLGAFIIFSGLVGINPWMVVPYTDTYSILFPALTFYLYLCAKQADKRYQEWILWGLAGLAGMVGYLIKPSAAIVLIAIVGYEVFRLAVAKGQRRVAAVHLGIILAAYFLAQGLWLHMLAATGSELNEEVRFSYTHYLMLGLNEENTGAYSSGDYHFSLSIPDRKTRSRENLRIVGERLQTYGVGGYLEFMCKKLLLNYNDGVFAWEQEGGFELAERNAPVTIAFQRVRRLFRCGTDWYGYYATFAQALWVFVLLAMPFILLGKKCGNSRMEEELILCVSLLGSFLFVMLFEARARYLYNMLPIYVMGAVVGLRKLSAKCA